MTLRNAAINLSRSRSLNRQRAANRGSIRATTPAPVRGWNTRDSFEEMRADHAILLENWIVQPNQLQFRPGYVVPYTDASEELRRILTWKAKTDEQLLVSTPSKILKLTYSGSWTSTTLGSGFTNGDWFSAMFNDRLGMVNGTDFPQIYDGVTLSNMTVSGEVPDPRNLTGIKIHKSRSYFWDRERLGFYYSEPNALGGILTYFPLRSIAQRGGYVISINTWTRDGGSGPDDFIVITTSEGEVLVYDGSDPGEADDWALVGRYYTTPPLNKWAFLEIDGKIFVATRNDVDEWPQRFLTQFGDVSLVSGAVQEAVQDVTTDNNLWGAFFDPSRRLMIFNMQIGASAVAQFVRGTGGWAKWTGLNARHWGLYRNETYFIGLGSLNQSLCRLANGPDNGSAITAVSECAYTPLRSNREKVIELYRAMLRCAGQITVNTRLAFDYGGAYGDQQQLVMSQADATDWGAEWDSDWTQINATRGEWFLGYGRGQTVSLRVEISSKINVQWMHNDWEYRPGGGL